MGVDMDAVGDRDSRSSAWDDEGQEDVVLRGSEPSADSRLLEGVSQTGNCVYAGIGGETIWEVDWELWARRSGRA